MNCIIVDDEPLARAEMEALINEVSSIEILGSFSNALTALDFLKSNQVDLVFLDIEMPMVTGLDFAAQLPGATLIIFTTAYAQYALKSYEFDAIDYLLKPVDKHRLDKAIKKAEAYQKLLSDSPERNTIEDIRFIEGLKDYVVIHLAGQKLITAMNLKTFHQKIPQDVFLRVSKSYVVNKNYIESFDHHTIYIGGSEIPLGEVYKKEFFTIYSGGSISPEI